MFEELVARIIGDGSSGVRLKIACCGLLWEVFPCIEVFEKTANGFNVVVGKLDTASLRSRVLISKDQKGARGTVATPFCLLATQLGRAIFQEEPDGL